MSTHAPIVLAALVLLLSPLAPAQVFRLSGDVYDGHGGPIGQGVYQVIGTIRVPPGKTLTITQPFGLTILKFDANGGILVQGALNVTVGCTFTSIHDDVAGGDTNGNGAATQPNPGDWNGIVWDWGSADSALQGCTFRYAGGRGQGAVYVHPFPAAPRVGLQSCRFWDGKGVAVVTNYSTGLVKDCKFERNAGAPLQGQLTRMNYANCTGSRNAPDAVRVMGDYRGWSSGVYAMRHANTFNGNAVFVVGQTLSVPAAGRLEIPAGTILKFERRQGVFNQGQLSVTGAAARKVYFTSVDDPTVGGDTNPGGPPPAAGDWAGIDCNTNGKTQLLHDCEVRYAGSNGYGVRFLSAPGALREAVIRDIKGDAVVFDEGAVAANTITGCTFRSVGGMVVDGLSWDSLATCAGNTIGVACRPHFRVRGRCIRSADISRDNLGGLSTILVSGVTRPVAGAHLRFMPGLVLKVEGGDIGSSFGRLEFLGTALDPIRITSHRDDSIGGDTNGDGNATAPRTNDWRGLSFVSRANNPADRCEHVYVRYAATGVYCNSPVTHLRSIWTDRCHYAGFELADAAGDVHNLIAAGSFEDGIRMTGGGFDVDHATVSGCGRYGVHKVNPGWSGMVRNSIAWQSGTANFAGLVASEVSHCCGGFRGTNGNIDADPRFVGAGNYRLVPGSPCIDAGLLGVGIATAKDHQEASRVLARNFSGRTLPDMGAYEVFDMALAINKKDIPLGDGFALWVYATNNAQRGTGVIAVGLQDASAFVPGLGVLNVGVATLMPLGQVGLHQQMVLAVPNQVGFLGLPVAFQALGLPANLPGSGALTNVVRPRLVR